MREAVFCKGCRRVIDKNAISPDGYCSGCDFMLASFAAMKAELLKQVKEELAKRGNP